MKLPLPATLRTAAVRGWRAAAVVVLAWMVWSQTRWLESRRPVQDVTLEEVQRIFPDAAAMVSGPGGAVQVLDAKGDPAGMVLRTSPHTDGIRGYSGPNDLLIGLDGEGRVQGIHMRRSGDTPDHVAMVERDEAFAAQFRGWKPGTEIQTVSGATLTSAAMAEAVQARLSGGTPSLRFPEQVTLEEVRAILPAAAILEPDADRLRVMDSSGAMLGYAVRTSPAADNVAGFRGPTEALAVLTPDGKIAGVRMRKSYDTESYVRQIREDEWFLAGFKGRTAEEIAKMDFEKEGIEGVSGATQTSWALVEGLKRRMAMVPAVMADAGKPRMRARDWLTVAVVACGLVMAFTRLRGHRWVRGTWQALLMAWALWTGGDLVSLALLGGWAQHGAAWQAAPGAALMVAVALLIPWSTRRQVYCHQLCPHGAAQEWLGRLRRRKLAIPAKAERWLRSVPWLLVAAAMIMLLLGRGDVNLMEPFDAWVLRAAVLIPLIIAAAGLLVSVFVPQAYCRYGCPTGALLGFLRSAGSRERLGRKDAAVMGLLILSGGVMGAAHINATTSGAASRVTVLKGAAMGSKWEIKLRSFPGDTAVLQRACADTLEKVEAELSLWRGDSAVSKFNAARTTDPQTVPASLVKLTVAAAEVSAATGGAFDVTAGPLVRLWGFGPPLRPERVPGEQEIGAALDHTGWQRITAGESSLARTDPLTEIDLTALTEGYAADLLAGVLTTHGAGEFLINVSGELRARGAWTIGIEHPARSMTLTNSALATSGTYRQQRGTGAQRTTHLIDARTGRPVAHRTVSVSVRHAYAMMADAWATALNVLGSQEGRPLAESLGIAAEFTEETDDGGLTVHATSTWR